MWGGEVSRSFVYSFWSLCDMPRPLASVSLYSMISCRSESSKLKLGHIKNTPADEGAYSRVPESCRVHVGVPSHITATLPLQVERGHHTL